MKLRGPLGLLAAAIVLAGILLAGCGSKPESPAAAGPQTCPTSNTEHFPKTRFTADAAIAAGLFHRYIWKAYREHKFAPGAPHRLLNFGKAALAGAAIYHFAKLARGHVYASPFLCRHLGHPFTRLAAAAGVLWSKLKHDQNVSGDIQSDNGLIASLHQQAKQSGASFAEHTVSVPGA